MLLASCRESQHRLNAGCLKGKNWMICCIPGVLRAPWFALSSSHYSCLGQHGHRSMSSWETRSLGQSTMKSWGAASAALCNSITLFGYELTVMGWSRCIGVMLLLVGKIPFLSLQNFILYTSSGLILFAVLNKIPPVQSFFFSHYHQALLRFTGHVLSNFSIC